MTDDICTNCINQHACAHRRMACHDYYLTVIGRRPEGKRKPTAHWYELSFYNGECERNGSTECRRCPPCREKQRIRKRAYGEEAREVSPAKQAARHCALTDEQVRYVLASDDSAPVLAERFCVGTTAIYDIRAGRTYGWVDRGAA